MADMDPVLKLGSDSQPEVSTGPQQTINEVAGKGGEAAPAAPALPPHVLTAAAVANNPAAKATMAAKAVGGEIPQWKDDPFGALGFVLSSVAAGFAGQEQPYFRYQRQALQMEQLNLARLNLGMQAMTTFDALVQKLPVEQQEAFADQFGKNFEASLPGFTQTLKTLRNRTDKKALLQFFGEHEDYFAPLMSVLPAEKLVELAGNKNLRENLDIVADARNRPYVTGKLETLQTYMKTANDVGVFKDLDPSVLKRDEKGNMIMTMADIEALNSKLSKDVQFTKSELGTLRRNPDVLLAYGIRTPKELEAEAQAAATARGTPDPLSPLAQLQKDLAEAKTPEAKAEIQKKIDLETTREKPQGAEFLQLSDRRNAIIKAGGPKNDTEKTELANIDARIAKLTEPDEKDTKVRTQKIADLTKILGGTPEANERAIKITDGIEQLVVNPDGRNFIIDRSESPPRRTLISSETAKKIGDLSITPVGAITPATMENLTEKKFAIEDVLRRNQGIMMALAGSGDTGFAGLDRTGKGIGARAFTENFLTQTLGMLPGQLGDFFTFSDTTQNRQRLKLFREDIIASLIKNPRLPAGEQTRLLDLTPDPDEFFQNPLGAAIKTRELMRVIYNEYEANNARMEGRVPVEIPPLPTGERGSPLMPVTKADIAAVAKMPPGTYFIDPENGTLQRVADPKKKGK